MQRKIGTFLLAALLTVALAPTLMVAGSMSAWAAGNEQANEKLGVTDTQVWLGTCGVLSGPVAYNGTQTYLGGKTYLDYVNDHGGVHGRKIHVRTYDDAYDPDKTFECFHKMLKDGAFAAAFFGGTPTAAKYAPMAEAAHVPMVGEHSGGQFLYDKLRPNMFLLRASYAEEAKALIDGLWENLGARKIAVAYQNDAFGAAIMSGAKEALKSHGTVPVALASFPRNSTDLSEAVKIIREAKPDAVIMATVYGPLADFVQRSYAAGWKPLVCAVSAVGPEAYIKAAGKNAEGTVISQVVPLFTRDDLPTVVLYKKALKKYAPGEQPNSTSLEAFVDGMVIVEGLRRAGRDLTRSKFLQALETLHDFDLGLGPKFKLNYSATHHTGFDSVTFAVVRGGHLAAFADWKQMQH
jgi:branched-chain amino acid transport system substrate-binding protein